MKNSLLFFFVALLPIFAGCSKIRPAEDRVNSAIQVGVYDSRSVAIAFIRSDVYKKTDGLMLKQWMDEYKTAKSENNKQKMEDLKSKAESLQEKNHQQGFGTASVDDILIHIPEQISVIKQQNKVQLLISKWDSESLEKYKTAKKIDVTSSLIEAFGPTDKQRECALGIQKFKPIENKKLKGKID